MTFHSENIDSVGFRRSALLAFLSLDGIQLAELDANPAIPTAPVPTWADARRGLRRLSLSEAANVLIGIDPLDLEWRSEEDFREFEGAKRIISDAVDDGEIQSVDINFERNGELIFNASDLRAWATSIGYGWPIPEMAPPSVHRLTKSTEDASNSSDLLKRFQESERERTHFKQEAERLQGLLREANARDGELAKQATQLGELQTEIAQGKTEIKRLQTEIAKGKSLPTLQKLLIAMAIDGYGYKPGDNKSPIPKQLEGITGGLAIEVTDETVLRHLRLATNTHLPSSAA